MSRQDKLKPPQIEDGPPERPVDDDRLQIDLRLNLDEVAAAEEEQLRSNARRRPTRKELIRLACKMYDARRARDRLIGSKLFGEPAWDMLLALYCLPSRGELMSVSGLSCAADNIPGTSGLRWQKILLHEGLVQRGPDGTDLRRQFVRLTPKGRSLLERYLIRLFYCDAPVPPEIKSASG
ncbi:DNA-binding MarR family transcriptional regulator [Sphingomonas sp. F9_3S_D5_B_2]